NLFPEVVFHLFGFNRTALTAHKHDIAREVEGFASMAHFTAHGFHLGNGLALFVELAETKPVRNNAILFALFLENVCLLPREFPETCAVCADGLTGEIAQLHVRPALQGAVGYHAMSFSA